MGAVGLRILNSFTFGNLVKFAFIVLQLGVLTLIVVGWCVVNSNTRGGVGTVTLGVAINCTSPTVIPLVSFRPFKQVSYKWKSQFIFPAFPLMLRWLKLFSSAAPDLVDFAYKSRLEQLVRRYLYLRSLGRRPRWTVPSISSAAKRNHCRVSGHCCP